VYDADDKLLARMVAAKVGADSDGGDGWFWSDGSALAGVGATDCTGCHAAPGARRTRRASRDVEAYPYVHLVRGSLLAELGQIDAARQALAHAKEHARNAHERAQIRAQLGAFRP
jgi:hypothetical protein